MTPEQCPALVAADTRAREAARDVVKAISLNGGCQFPQSVAVASARLAVALAEFDRAMEEQK